MERYPCMQLLYMLPDSDQRAQYLLNIAGMTGIKRSMLTELFHSFPEYRELFQAEMPSEGQILKYFEQPGYTNCQDIVLEKKAAYKSSMVAEPCQLCSYSAKYLNAYEADECQVLLYLLYHPGIMGTLPEKKETYYKSVKTFGKGGIGSKIYTLPMYRYIYIACRKNIKSDNHFTDLSAIEQFDQAKAYMMRYSLRSCEDDRETVWQQMRDEFAKAEKRFGKILSDEEYQRKARILEKRKVYFPRVLPCSGIYPGYTGRRDQNGVPNFLLPVLPPSSAGSHSASTGRNVLPSERKVFHSKDELLESLKQKEVKNSRPPEPESKPAALFDGEIDKDLNKFLEDAEKSIAKEEAPDVPEQFEMQTEVIEDEEILSEATPLLPPADELLDTTEAHQKENIDTQNSIFDKEGYIDIEQEVKSYCILSVLPEDMLDFLNQLCKEEWIGIECAKNGAETGLYIYGGSNKLSGFVREDRLDPFLFTTLLQNPGLVAITQNAMLIFSIMLRNHAYFLPNLRSLAAEYNALNNDNVKHPQKRLYGCLEGNIRRFSISPTIEHISNYGEIDKRIGIRLEQKKRYKRVQAYLHYEYMLGTAYDISDIIRMQGINMEWINYTKSTFRYDPYLKKLENGTIITVKYTVLVNGRPVDLSMGYEIMAYILGYLLKGGLSLPFQLRLLLCQPGLMVLYTKVMSRDRLGYLEEILSANIGRRCKDFRMEPPRIEINYG